MGTVMVKMFLIREVERLSWKKQALTVDAMDVTVNLNTKSKP
jgi:hypothetical protein